MQKFYTIYMFYTAQQTSVYSVHSVVKNDSSADLPRASVIGSSA